MKHNGKCFIICPYDETDTLSEISVLENDIVICADASYIKAAEHGITPDYIIGDFDSGSRPKNANCEIIEYPSEKDDTDTMLCVKKAIELGCKDIVIVGGIGGRLDHTLANISALLYADERDVKAILNGSGNKAFIVSSDALIKKEENTYISFFPITATACISLAGTKYKASDLTIEQSFPIGTSNEITEDFAEITIHNGKILAVISRK